jgi:hypothetical protein
MSDDLVVVVPPPAAPRDGTQPLYPLTVDKFRLLFPAFADETKVLDETIQLWLDLGAGFVNCSWGPTQAFGQGLWAAHELAKMTMAAQAGPGNLSGIGGITNSKSVGPVSLGYDTGIGVIESAGSYNLTLYGRQWYQFARIFGMGPYQLGPPEPAPLGSGPAWLGPAPYRWFDL